MILSSAIGCSTLCSIWEQFWQQAAWRLYTQLLLGLFQSSPPEGDRPAERCDSEYRTLIFKQTTQSKINFPVMLLMTAICVTKDKAVGESWSWSWVLLKGYWITFEIILIRSLTLAHLDPLWCLNKSLVSFEQMILKCVTTKDFLSGAPEGWKPWEPFVVLIVSKSIFMTLLFSVVASVLGPCFSFLFMLFLNLLHSLFIVCET